MDPDEMEELVITELGGTALFGARFRENAARALLIPRRRPGQRTPLWQQRLKAQGLLQVARRYADFPVVLETYRECLQDVFDLPALSRTLLAALRQRRIDLVEVETPSASPYASSLLFDYVATYMYEDDTPLAERRAQASRSTATCSRSCSARRSSATSSTRAPSSRWRTSSRRSRDADELHDLLLRRGDLRPASRRRAGGRLEAERRAVRVRVAGEERLIAAEDAGRYRDASARCRPRGCRTPTSRAGRTRSAGSSAASRAGAARSRPRRRPSASAWRPTPSRRSSRSSGLVRGELRPGGTEREWSEPDVLRRLRRASLAALRKEIEPPEPSCARPLPARLARHRPARELREALVPLQGISLPVALWESDFSRAASRLPARAPRPAHRLWRGRLGRAPGSSASPLLP